MADDLELDLDSIISRLLACKYMNVLYYRLASYVSSMELCTVLIVTKSRNVKIVQLKIEEVRNLCLKSREIFLSQPTLLELEAPITICGMQLTVYIM